MPAGPRALLDPGTSRPADFVCGPYALRHAIAALGRFVSLDELAATAGTTVRDGTGPEGLAAAARSAGCKLVPFERPVFASARAELIQNLRGHRPCLLLVRDMGHWVAVVGMAGRRFVVIDSVAGEPVSVWDEPTLRKLWRSRHEDTGRRVYEGHAVVPAFRPRLVARWTPEAARAVSALGRWDFDRPVALLARHAASPADPGAVPMDAALASHRRMFGAGTFELLIAMARVYGLKVSPDRVKALVEALRRCVEPRPAK